VVINGLRIFIDPAILDSIDLPAPIPIPLGNLGITGIFGIFILIGGSLGGLYSGLYGGLDGCFVFCGVFNGGIDIGFIIDSWKF